MKKLIILLTAILFLVLSLQCSDSGGGDDGGDDPASELYGKTWNDGVCTDDGDSTYSQKQMLFASGGSLTKSTLNFSGSGCESGSALPTMNFNTGFTWEGATADPEIKQLIYIDEGSIATYVLYRLEPDGSLTFAEQAGSYPADLTTAVSFF